jgi:organic hydroperoxide reductase OsmC/OhrA
MLWFLSLAAKKGLRVNRYLDLAEGRMDRNEAGKLVMLEVCLRPKVEWDGEQPDTATVAAIHHSAHDECFIANSVRTKVTIELK